MATLEVNAPRRGCREHHSTVGSDNATCRYCGAAAERWGAQDDKTTHGLGAVGCGARKKGTALRELKAVQATHRAQLASMPQAKLGAEAVELLALLRGH